MVTPSQSSVAGIAHEPRLVAEADRRVALAIEQCVERASGGLPEREYITSALRDGRNEGCLRVDPPYPPWTSPVPDQVTGRAARIDQPRHDAVCGRGRRTDD